MPYSKRARYRHSRRLSPSKFVSGSFRTVPLSHTGYSGKKYAVRGAKAVVGRLRNNGWCIQSVLIPKR